MALKMNGKGDYQYAGWRGTANYEITATSEDESKMHGACNACAKYPLADNDKVVITYGYDHSRTNITLCKDCARELQNSISKARAQ